MRDDYSSEDMMYPKKNNKTEILKAVVFESNHSGSSLFIETLKDSNFVSDNINSDELWSRKIDVDGQKVRVQLCDIKPFRNVNEADFSDAKIAFIVCDLNQINTFNFVPIWNSKLASTIKSLHTTVLIFLNAQGLAKNNSNFSEDNLNRFIQRCGIDGYFFADPRANNDEPLRFALRKHFHFEKKIEGLLASLDASIEKRNEELLASLDALKKSWDLEAKPFSAVENASIKNFSTTPSISSQGQEAPAQVRFNVNNDNNAPQRQEDPMLITQIPRKFQGFLPTKTVIVPVKEKETDNSYYKHSYKKIIDDTKIFFEKSGDSLPKPLPLENPSKSHPFSTIPGIFNQRPPAQARFDVNNDNNAPQIPAQPAVAPNHQPAAVSSKKPYLEDAPTKSETKTIINSDISSLEENAQELKTLLEQIEEQGLTDQIPAKFECAFANEPMIYPAQAADGACYEYRFIAAYMKCQMEKGLPMRGKYGTDIENTNLVARPDLQKELLEFCKKLLASKENQEEQAESPSMTKK